MCVCVQWLYSCQLHVCMHCVWTLTSVGTMVMFVSIKMGLLFCIEACMHRDTDTWVRARGMHTQEHRHMGACQGHAYTGTQTHGCVPGACIHGDTGKEQCMGLCKHAVQAHTQSGKHAIGPSDHLTCHACWTSQMPAPTCMLMHHKHNCQP